MKYCIAAFPVLSGIGDPTLLVPHPLFLQQLPLTPAWYVDRVSTANCALGIAEQHGIVHVKSDPTTPHFP